MHRPKYLVTGGVGFIGGHIVRALVEAGESVRVVDDLSGGGDPASILDTPHGDRIELLKGDVRDAALLAQAVKGVEGIFHMAALVSVPQSVAEPLLAESINAHGTLMVLEAARHAGVRRMLLAASSAAYGRDPTLPKRETMLPQPLSPYAVSKVAAEHYLAAYAALHGLETLCLRYFNVFGPGQNPNGPYAAAIPRFLSAIIAGHKISIFGDGEQTRDFVYIKDVVHANLLGIQSPNPLQGQVVNIANGIATSLNDLVTFLRAHYGEAIQVEYLPERAGDVKHSVADITAARRLLGFEPSIPWQQGIQPTYEDLKGPSRSPQTA